MGEKEYERMKVQMQGSSYILKINSFLCKLGIGSKIIDREKNNFNNIQIEMDKLYTYPQKYMQYFSEYGFVPYSSIDFTMMEKSIHLFEEGKVEESIENISNYYSAEKIEERFFLINNSDIKYERIRLIKNVLEDYRNERYYAVIPILLMMIDGMVSDMMKYGMHSEKSKLSTWDMFDAEDDGLRLIKDIFLKGRNKTTTENIHFPYRNGILHGRDLGYDTKEVAILSWVYLFALIDFIKNKKSEDDRKEKYIKDTKKVSFSELTTDIKNLEESNKNIARWKARVISDKYIESINIKLLIKQSNIYV